MEKKAKRIKKIQFISNTILANACYHVKEMEAQLSRAEKSKGLTEKEEKIITQAWEYRNVLANELIDELKEFLGGNNGEKNA